MKMIWVLILAFLIASSVSVPVRANDEEVVKASAAQLCASLMKTDKAGFESLLAKRELQYNLQWWWDSSGKGKYFATLYGKCEFVRIENGSKENRKTVYIQRYEKDGKTPWSRPAPVTFEKGGDGKWTIIGYSL